MTVFKAFLKVLAKNKTTIIMYTVILISFGTISVGTEAGLTFKTSKPKVVIVNKDEYKSITKSLIKYIKSNSKIVKIEDNNEDKINDALFYQEVNYVIYIPKNYSKDILEGKDIKLDVKKGITANAEFEEMILKRYINVLSTYRKSINSEKELISKIDETLNKKVKVEMNTKIDTGGLKKLAGYYNFASYSFLATLLFIICLVLSSFKEQNVSKRITISSMNYKKHNRILLLSNCLYSFVIWIFYIFLSYIMVGDIVFSKYGLLYILNSFVFVIIATSLAFLIGNAVKNKNAINALVNIIALGSSFLCGAFVPMEYLPKSVLKIAHVLPTYYYVSSNELITKLEKINLNTLTPYFKNIAILLTFGLVFIIITNVITRKNRKIG